jgi:glycosyltransferase involved in cell wall biosynthesis
MPTLGYLIPEFPGQTHVWMWRELVALRAAGADVRVVSTRRPPPDACRHEFADEARRTTHYLYPPAVTAVLGRPLGMLRACSYLLGLGESSIKQKAKYVGLAACAADLTSWSKRHGIGHVHAHSCGDAAHVVAMSAAMGGPTYSLTLHGDLPVYGSDHRSKMRQARFVATAGEHLIPPVVQQAGVEPARAWSNPMGTDTDRFVDNGRRSPAAGRLQLLTVARLHRCKGHVYALEAVRRVIDRGVEVHYTLAGSGPHEQEIRQDVARLGLDAAVTFLGSVGEATVIDLLQTHDAYLLTSIGLGEASPVGVMEAMSCQCVALCSNIGSTASMIQHDTDGIVVGQGDVDAIEAALLRLAADPALRRRLGAAARTKAVQRFDSRTLALKLLERIEATTGSRFRR